jgi:hypothetical protein
MTHVLIGYFLNGFIIKGSNFDESMCQCVNSFDSLRRRCSGRNLDQLVETANRNDIDLVGTKAIGSVRPRVSFRLFSRSWRLRLCSLNICKRLAKIFTLQDPVMKLI